MPPHWWWHFSRIDQPEVDSHDLCDSSVPSSEVQQPLGFPVRADPQQLLELLGGEHEHGASAQKPGAGAAGQRGRRDGRAPFSNVKQSVALTRWWRCVTPWDWGQLTPVSDRAVWKASQISPDYAWEKSWCLSPDGFGQTGGALIHPPGQDSTDTTKPAKGR